MNTVDVQGWQMALVLLAVFSGGFSFGYWVRSSFHRDGGKENDSL